MVYADVCKAALPELDKEAFQKRLDSLLSGRATIFEATYSLKTPRGRERRQVHITPLQEKGATRFVAIHEDLTERARILATLDETSDQLLHAQEQEASAHRDRAARFDEPAPRRAGPRLAQSAAKLGRPSR
jgi:hypothetical protein